MKKTPKKPSRKFKHIRTKMIFSFSCVIIASLIFIIYFSVTTYGNKIEENHISYSEQVIKNLLGNINSYIDEVETITNSITYNYYIQSYLIERNDPKKSLDNGYDSSINYQASLESLSNITSLRADINSIFIFDQVDLALYKSQSMLIDLSRYTIDKSWFSSEKDIPKKLFFVQEKNNSTKLPNRLFTFARVFERYDGLGTLGIIFIDTNLSIIQRYFTSAALDRHSFIVLLDSNDQLIEYSKIPDSILQQSTFSISELYEFIPSSFKDHYQSNNAEKKVFKTKIGDATYLIVLDHIERTGWTLATITDYKGILNDTNTVRNYIVFVGFITLLILILITYIISSRITTPIASLTNTMNLIHKGDLSHKAEVTTFDEVGDLATSFNYMIERINILMNEVVEEQEEKRKSEIRVLQDQINPHFLYNTLDSIIWMAEVKDPNTVPMIEALSDLFRISLNKGQEMISIQEEIEHVKNYLYILSMRYYEKFDYSFDIDPKTHTYRIPKLLLQPLVENAIYHGIKNKPIKGQIKIRAYYTEKNLILSVSDNGIGMSETKVRTLLSKDTPPSSEIKSGIGVKNIHQRIGLYFGSDYGITVESEEGNGTIISINLPATSL